MKIYERVIFINKEKERKCEIKSLKEERGKRIGLIIILSDKRYNFFGSFDKVERKINAFADTLKEISEEMDIDLGTLRYNITQAMITAELGEKERVITYYMWGGQYV